MTETEEQFKSLEEMVEYVAKRAMECIKKSAHERAKTASSPWDHLLLTGQQMKKEKDYQTVKKDREELLEMADKQLMVIIEQGYYIPPRDEMQRSQWLEAILAKINKKIFSTE